MESDIRNACDEVASAELTEMELISAFRKRTSRKGGRVMHGGRKKPQLMALVAGFGICCCFVESLSTVTILKVTAVMGPWRTSEWSG